jgi:hypothetical protein
MVAFLADPSGPPVARGLGGMIRRLFGGRPPRRLVVEASDRKFRLLTVACCRYLWRTAQLPYADLPLYREGGWLERLQRLADDELTDEDQAVIHGLEQPHLYHTLTAEQLPIQVAVLDYPRMFWRVAAYAAVIPMFQPFFPDASALGCELVRDIFGNPFRVQAFDPAWRTSTVLELTRSSYDSGDFSILPILADALQEAGCEDAAVLDHCRAGGPHVRGCWVVDAVLQKS